MSTIQKKNYNVLPGPSMGVVTPEYLEALAAAARKHRVPFLKLTSAQRFAIAGHSPEAAQGVWQDLGHIEGPRKRIGIAYVQACPGMRWCKYGRMDSLALGEKIENRLREMPLPAKTKIGISGCPMNCCESYIRDVGIFAKKAGWTLVFGGNGGGLPRIGEVVATGLNDEEVIKLAGQCLNFYRSRARKLERTARFMERTPIEELRQEVLG